MRWRREDGDGGRDEDGHALDGERKSYYNSLNVMINAKILISPFFK
jgi:hypothetical protein